MIPIVTITIFSIKILPLRTRFFTVIMLTRIGQWRYSWSSQWNRGDVIIFCSMNVKWPYLFPLDGGQGGVWRTHSLVARIHYLHTASRGLKSQKNSMVEVGRAFDLKEVMTWAKVTSLVCIFCSLPWQNGPNTQFQWKLRYSPIQCAYLEPPMTFFSDRRRTRISFEIGN